MNIRINACKFATMFLAAMSFVCTTHATNIKLDYFELNDVAGKTFGTTAQDNHNNPG